MNTCPNYIILNHTVIFDLYFDELLNDTHYAIISQYPKVIFETFFNKPIILPLNLTHATFGYQFKQSVILSKNLTHLIFNDKYNVEIFLTKNMRCISIGDRFNKPIFFNKLMEHVSLGQRYNQKLKLNKNIAHLTLDCESYIHPVFLTKKMFRMMFTESYICSEQLILPKNLTHLQLAFGYNKPIILTTHINTLIINAQYNKNIYFEKPISYLEIVTRNNFINDNLPNNITLLKIRRHESVKRFFDNMPNCVKKIDDDRFRYAV